MPSRGEFAADRGESRCRALSPVCGDRCTLPPVPVHELHESHDPIDGRLLHTWTGDYSRDSVALASEVRCKFADVLARDKVYREHAAKAAKASVARSKLPPGTSRARVTTANARWMRAAEARDERERLLREQWETPAKGLAK